MKTKALLSKMVLLLAVMFAGAGTAWATTKTVTYAWDSSSKAFAKETTTSDDVDNATISTTTTGTSQSNYQNKTAVQLMSANNGTDRGTATLTLTSFPYQVTGISANYRTTSGSKTGSINAKVSGSTIASYSTALNNSSNWADLSLSFSGTHSGGETLVIEAKYTTNSVYIHSFTITYSIPSEAYTVTFGDDGSSATEESAGNGITLPTRTAPAGYEFAGWTTSDITEETTSKPSILTGLYKPSTNITLYPVYTRIDGTQTTATASQTISDYATANNWQSNGAANYGSVVLDDHITATCNTDGNNGKYYTDWRMYQTNKAVITLTAASGYELLSATFTFSVTNTGALFYGEDKVESDKAITISGKTAKFEVGNSGSATNGQVRITAISVKYQATATTYYTSHPAADLSFSIGEAEWATYVATATSSFPTGVKGYIVTETSTTSVKLAEVAVVTKGTPVIVNGAEGSYTMDEADEEELEYNEGVELSDSKLLVSNGTDAQGSDIFVLSKKGEDVGFYRWTSENSLSKGKVYLKISGVNNARLAIVFGDDATGIDSIERAAANEHVYNLQGVRVAQPTKGLYIVNGKKVVIK